MKYVEEWKEYEVERTYEDYKKYCDRINELTNIWKEKGGEQNYNAMKYYKYSNKYYYGLTYMGNQSEDHIKDVIRISVNQHFEKLQQKVEKKIGKIIKIIQINGNIYAFEGELDNCNVEVILAGGYNVQRLHTRWIITKNYDR